jgi:drug/metabolite transporter (DMT)-like permease
MTHRQGVWLMVVAALMWSIAGVVTRHLDAARSFEVTFWRSAFNALGLVVLLAALRGPAALKRNFIEGGRALWLSGLCWAVMFTAFMLALTLTRVANVLVTMAIAPLLTALGARVFLNHRLNTRTWLAITTAGIGIAWMYGQEVQGGDTRHLLGVLVAMCVPVASAVNWTLLQHQRGHANPPDMWGAVLIGALLSAALTLPLAWPFAASIKDLSLLALLGVVQLAIPCLMAVAAARVLSGPEASLLSLLEVVFGVLWAWWGANEAPSLAVLGGGALVLAALVLAALVGNALTTSPSASAPRR